jgi:hypothetical protein
MLTVTGSIVVDLTIGVGLALMAISFIGSIGGWKA